MLSYLCSKEIINFLRGRCICLTTFIISAVCCVYGWFTIMVFRFTIRFSCIVNVDQLHCSLLEKPFSATCSPAFRKILYLLYIMSIRFWRHANILQLTNVPAHPVLIKTENLSPASLASSIAYFIIHLHPYLCMQTRRDSITIRSK